MPKSSNISDATIPFSSIEFYLNGYWFPMTDSHVIKLMQKLVFKIKSPAAGHYGDWKFVRKLLDETQKL